MTREEKIVREILAKAGITLNGTSPWDMRVHNEQLYARLLGGNSLSVGESYMDGWWDVERFDEMVFRFFKAGLHHGKQYSARTIFELLRVRLLNLQSQSRAVQVAEVHYDLGNKMFERMLGDSMVYTCAYWKDAKNLTEAQFNKLDLVCRKIGLKSGDRVLDIGCGFGSFAKFAAEKYGAHVVGVSVSREQIAYARESVKGLPVEIRFQDYRDISDGPYDHIVSIGMFEAVGYKNYATFMRKVHSLLKDDGLFLLHTIGAERSRTVMDPWIDKYIFPNGMLPSIAEIGSASEGVFTMEDWHTFGADYDKTLMAWHKNFVEHWEELKDDYDERFYRMWTFYLLLCAGMFRARYTNLWQIVFSKSGVPGGYQSVR